MAVRGDGISAMPHQQVAVVQQRFQQPVAICAMHPQVEHHLHIGPAPCLTSTLAGAVAQ